MDDMFQRMRVDLERATRGDPTRLENFGFKVHSQSDEDGIIQEIFARIGLTNRVFVEFGVENGLECNSLYLLEQGWSGLWMEGHPFYKEAIRVFHERFIQSGQLKFESVLAYPDNINQLIAGVGITGEIDMLSIDIDSNDYHVWKAIDVINPRVVIVEHNPCYPPPTEYIMPFDRDYYWNGGPPIYGASLDSCVKLAEELGYTLVGCGLYSPNGFYVRNDLLCDHFSGPFTAENFFSNFSVEGVMTYPVSETPLARRLVESERASAAPLD